MLRQSGALLSQGLSSLALPAAAQGLQQVAHYSSRSFSATLFPGDGEGAPQLGQGAASTRAPRVGGGR